MLVLSRKLNQSIMVGDEVRIVIVAIDRDTVKLGIEAPREIAVHRSEVYDEIRRANESAVSGAASPTPAPAVVGGAPSARPKSAPALLKSRKPLPK